MERTDFVANAMLSLVGATFALLAVTALLATSRFKRARWMRANAQAEPAACGTCGKARELRRAGPLSVLSVLLIGGAVGVTAFAVEALDTMLSSAWNSGEHVLARNLWFAAWGAFALPGTLTYAATRVEPRCAACERPRWCETCRRMRPTVHTC